MESYVHPEYGPTMHTVDCSSNEERRPADFVHHGGAPAELPRGPLGNEAQASLGIFLGMLSAGVCWPELSSRKFPSRNFLYL